MNTEIKKAKSDYKRFQKSPKFNESRNAFIQSIFTAQTPPLTKIIPVYGLSYLSWNLTVIVL